MLSTRKKDISDSIIIGALNKACLERVCLKYNLRNSEVEFLLRVHIIQKATNRYATREQLNELFGRKMADNWFYTITKVLFQAGYIERISQAYNVTIEGLGVIRSYETIVARKANEIKRGQVKNWKRVPNDRKKQILNKQYPPRMMDTKKRAKKK